MGKVVAINKDTLYFKQTEEGSFYVNGVKIDKGIGSGSSTIFIIESIIPKIDTPEALKKKYEVIVYNINTTWSPENNKEYESMAENITLKIYRKSIGGETRHIETLKTDRNGIAIFATDEMDGTVSFYYEVVNEKANLCLGFKVTGLFTSQEQLNENKIYYGPSRIEKR